MTKKSAPVINGSSSFFVLGCANGGDKRQSGSPAGACGGEPHKKISPSLKGGGRGEGDREYLIIKMER